MFEGCSAPDSGTGHSPLAAAVSAHWNCWLKQKRLAKTAPVPCVVRDGGIAEEDSLAENVQRVALHPLDQFRAFQALREKGLGDEEIAATVLREPDRGEATPCASPQCRPSCSTSMPRTA